MRLLKNIVNKYLEKNNYLIIFRNGSAIGDHVYMSSVIREIYIKTNKKILLFTNYFDLYLNNSRIYKLFKIKKKSFIWFFLKNLKGHSILEFRSINENKSKEKHFLFYHKKKNIHLAEAMSEHFNRDINYDNLKNEFFFSENEIQKFDTELKLPRNFSLIQSSSKKTFTKNKEWKLEGMQAIVDHFKDICWIQIGKSDEPILNNCRQIFDIELRKLAFIIFKCDFLVTYEGLFNHLASCFEKKNFLIHTGFLPIEASYYKNNIIIEKNMNLNCYPCFSINCNNHKEFCNDYIKEEHVINKIRENIEL